MKLEDIAKLADHPHVLDPTSRERAIAFALIEIAGDLSNLVKAVEEVRDTINKKL